MALATISKMLDIDALTLTIFGIAVLRLLPAFQRVYVAYTQIRFGERTLSYLESIIEQKLSLRDEELPVLFDDFQLNKTQEGYNLLYRKDHLNHAFKCHYGLNLVFGASGVGKTCFMNALQDKYLEKSKYSSATMQQDAYLFNGSLYENVVFGREYEDSRLKKLTEILFGQDHERINHKSLTNISVSDNGSGLSGGQIQRICLLRTLLVKKDIYLLDEGFANLNPELRDTLFKKIHHFLLEDESIAIVITHSYNKAHSYNYMEIN